MRRQWAGMQEELFDSAYDVAAEGARMMDAGRDDELLSRLSSYMAENTTRMLEEARVLLRDLEVVPA